MTDRPNLEKYKTAIHSTAKEIARSSFGEKREKFDKISKPKILSAENNEEILEARVLSDSEALKIKYSDDNILNKNGCETIYWKTGHSHIKRKVNVEKALAGFEKSGHFFFNQPLGFGYDDGINSAIQVCHLLIDQNKKMSQILKDLPITYQTPTMAPYCKDEEKYKVVDEVVQAIQKLKDKGTKIDNQSITEILTVNGARFTLEDGSWGLVRASSNKPSLVVVTESTHSDSRKKEIFKFIDDLLEKTGKIGEYDQKI